jgi:hypothetical protein
MPMVFRMHERTRWFVRVTQSTLYEPLFVCELCALCHITMHARRIPAAMSVRACGQMVERWVAEGSGSWGGHGRVWGQ